MARDRIISPAEQPADDESAAGIAQLRPTRLDEFIGQPELKEKLGIAVEAARQRRDPMEHVLLHGPPGLGKTTLAHLIAEAMNAQLHVTSGPALTKAGDLVGTLTRMQTNDVLFIDEIHRLPAAVEEYIYPAMEDYKIDFTLDSGMHARVVTYQLQPFTLIGATTRAGLLSGPLRSRFGLSHHLQFYGAEDLLTILKRSAALLGLTEAADDALRRIADRSRGTPRVANRLLRRVRDFAQVRRDGRIDESVIRDALTLEGIDDLGLDHLDRSYMRTIARVYEGGPAGLEAIAATMGEDAGTLEDVVEPYLLQVGFVARTRQGRRLTAAAFDHLGVDRPAGAVTSSEASGDLFGGEGGR